MRRLLPVLFATLLPLACSGEGGDTDSESHWQAPLGPCQVDDDCADGLSCDCGVCTEGCEANEGCAGLGAGVQCVPGDELPASCSMWDGVTSGVCLKSCAASEECGEGRMCDEGACVAATTTGGGDRPCPGETVQAAGSDYCVYTNEESAPTCPSSFPVPLREPEYGLVVCGPEGATEADQPAVLDAHAAGCEAATDAGACESRPMCFWIPESNRGLFADGACQPVEGAGGICVLIPEGSLNNAVGTCNYRTTADGSEAFTWGSDQTAHGWSATFDMAAEIPACGCL